MSILSLFIAVVFAFISYAIYRSYIDVYPSVVKKADKRYDYIVVGAGTAGCVLAARLSEDPYTKVLLVEAGDQMSWFTKVPLIPTAAQQGVNDWSVNTESQKYSSFGLWGQSQIIPRGKGLGGSGQINFLLHSFGLPEDYQRWTNPGFQGWRLEDLEPYFMKAFGTTNAEYDSGDCLGECKEVPMKLKLIDHQNDLMRVFREASRVTPGYKVFFRKPTATIHAGRRHSTLDGYLVPALKRKNLHVLLNTQAVSIRFENQTASSLYILTNHILLDNIFAKKEIIICAGAIKSPQLLMLSGIGPREVLKRLKVRPVVENEAVGRNLHDHMNLPVYVSIQKPFSITLAKVFTFGTVWQYFWNKGGLLSFPPVAGVEYHNSSALMLFSMGTASERLLRDLSNYNHQVFRDTFPFHNSTIKEGFMFLATCLQPSSRGRVKVTDVSTAVPPAVDPNYLSNYNDVQCMIRDNSAALRRAEKLIASRPFKEIGARIHWPRPERCRTFWRYTRNQQLGVTMKKKMNNISLSPPDVYLECVLREVAVTGHHAGGTCAGGTVVDSSLRVKSVNGVRVVDASVLPAPVSLYPNSVLVGIAEKAAHFIKEGT